MRPLNPCLRVCSFPNAWLFLGGLQHATTKGTSTRGCNEARAGTTVVRPVPAQTASVLTTQSRYESRFAQEDDSTSPTIMAIARTKGYTVKTDIFQVEQISNNHPCWCWVLSLSLLGLYYTLHAWTQQQQPTPPPHKGARPTRN